MAVRRIGMLILVPAVSLGVFTALAQAQTAKPKPATKPAATTQQTVPAEYQEGIAQLRVAKGYLEKAGDKWGGYRVKGIASIDATFRTFGVNPQSTRDEMESGNVDEPGMMDSGISNLETARADISNVSDNWGGRKDKALALLDQALKDLQTGVDWAKEHKTY